MGFCCDPARAGTSCVIIRATECGERVALSTDHRHDSGALRLVAQDFDQFTDLLCA